MLAQGQSISERAVISSPDQIRNILSSCTTSRRPAVMVDSDFLQSYDWKKVAGAVQIDLSAMAHISVSGKQRLALVGPGAKYSSIWSETSKIGLAPDFEPLLGIDFKMGDWTLESLRMISTTNSGLDGILRNVKVVAPTRSFQTGFDNSPANGGGYDLTKLYMTSGATLGVPYEFAIPLRPLPEKMVEKEYAFTKLQDAVEAGIKMHKTGYVKLINICSSGFNELLMAGKKKSGSSMNNMFVRIEGSNSYIESAESTLDEIARASKVETKGTPEVMSSPKLIDQGSIAKDVRPIGICTCNTSAIGNIIQGLSQLDRKKDTIQYFIADLNPNSSLIIPLISEAEISQAIPSYGSFLVEAEIPLRGQMEWNSLKGDTRAESCMQVVRAIKRFLDPGAILNPHVLGA